MALSNFIESFKMVSIPANGLSNDYFAFSIGEYRDKITRNNINLLDMLEFLGNQNSQLVLFKESDTKVFGVYSINNRFNPTIISGRTFSEEDFRSRTNTIIISKELENDCVEKEGKMFYNFDANYFEVIGVFKQSNNPINKDALAYYNLASGKLMSKNPIYDNYIFGRFQMDAGSETEEVVSLLNDYCTVEVLKSTTDNRFSERLQKTISAQGITLFPIILIIFLIILNSVSISSNWIENRKREIFVRRLVGATNQKISIMLLKDFLLISTSSYILALLFIVNISRLDLIIFLGFKFSTQTIIFSYIITILTGLISIGSILITYYKNNISQIRG